MKRRVNFHGILLGSGRKASCTVSATMVTLRGTKAVRYIDYSIRDESRELPDGQYELVANGETMVAIRHKRSWII
jgi:hypothetical protein